MTDLYGDEISSRFGLPTFAEWLPTGTRLGDVSQVAVDVLWQQYDQVIWLKTGSPDVFVGRLSAGQRRA